MLIKAAGGRVHGDASGGVEIPDDAVQRSRSTMEGSLFIFPEKKPVRSEIVIAGKCRVWRLVRTTIFFTLRNYAPRLILLGLIFATSAQAQTAQFSVSQTMIPSSKLYSPYRVAVDSTGNVYISDTQSNRVLKETWSSDGSYAESLVASTGLNLPCGIAVDSSGIIYFADELNARILRETPSGSGYVETQVSTSNLYLPTGVAVDHLGNIYIADTGNRRVLKETPFSGGYVETVVSSSGLPQVVGIAVDSGGNIFLSDVNTMQIYKEAPSGGAYLQTTIATTGLSHPYDIAVDAADNLYISDFDNARVIKETLSVGSYVQSVYPTYALRGGLGLALDISGNLYLADTLGQVVWKLSAAGGNLGPVRVGDQSRVGYLIFSFSGGSGGALTLGGARVVTQGFGGLDYADSGSGDCSTSVPYTAGDTCTIGVFFTPQYPGQRLGSAEVTDSTNHILAAGYISGSGIAPQINFVSGLESVVLSSASLHPQGLALDASGNIYIADCLNDVVLKITPLGIQSTVADSSGGMAGPENVAVDGSGAVYIADAVNNQILKQTPAGSGYVQSIIANAATSGLNAPYGVAVDGSGNVYIADTHNNRILLETLSSGNYTQTVIPTSGLDLPHAVAVDLHGNVYIADYGNNRVVMETFAGGTYSQSTISSGLNGPTGVSVDANCNVYIAEYNANRIVKETVIAAGYSRNVIPTSPLLNPFGVALDSTGNVYLSDLGNRRVLKEDFADPPSLNFATTNVGSKSTDSPKSATLFNFGNAALNINVPAMGTNPSLATSNFDVDPSTTCPQVTPAGTIGIMAANSSCTYAVDFLPATGGTDSDNLILTDDSLNQISARQAIPLNGAGVLTFQSTTIKLSAIPISPISFGDSLTLTATLNPFSFPGKTTDGESVTFKNGAITLGTGNLTSGAASITLTTLGVGTNSLTAVFGGDANFGASSSSPLIIVVGKSTPAITWAPPAAIPLGAALSAAQLNATASVPGTFVYNPGLGVTPAIGVDTLSVAFTPTDTIDFNNASATVPITVFDFTFLPNAGSATQTVNPGSAATFALLVVPVGSPTIPSAVTFAATGLPNGATATFSPASLAPGSPAVAVNLIVQTSSSGAVFVRKPLYVAPIGSAFLALILFSASLMGLGPFRRRLNYVKLKLGSALVVILTLAALATLTGCPGISVPGGPGSGTTTDMAAIATSGPLHQSVKLILVIHK